MKEKYITAEMEIVVFDTEDVIRTSDTVPFYGNPEDQF